MIIAVDGPAASGKGTLAAGLARHYRLPHLDTGLLYRAVARAVITAGWNLEDERRAATLASTLNLAQLGDPDLRTAEIGEAASVVAKHPAVRTELLAFQREIANTPPGAVLDGRDIGTVVCPDADVKIFVTADTKVRAQRRFEEYVRRGEKINYEEVLDIIRARDARDMNRLAAPLVQAPDARPLDTTNMDVETAFQAALAIIYDVTGRR